MSQNSGGFNGSNFIAEFKSSMGNMGMSAASAASAISSFTGAANAAFPSAKEQLDRVKAMDRAIELLRDDDGPPDAIRVLAAQRAKELGVQVSFMRTIDSGVVLWTVVVRTKRGSVAKSPHLTEKQKQELALEFIPVEAWKNAMRDAGLL